MFSIRCFFLNTTYQISSFKIVKLLSEKSIPLKLVNLNQEQSIKFSIFNLCGYERSLNDTSVEYDINALR